MSKKAVLITGAARRLGRAIALEFAQAGYDVALHYWRSQHEALQLQKEIDELGQQTVLLSQNLANAEDLPRLMQRAREAFPHMQVLVNNASIFRRIGFMEITQASLLEDFNLNFIQALLLTQAFAMQVQKGAIVNMLDTAINTRRTTHFAYLLAKKSLAEFTQMAARELAPDIRINAVCPGFILPTEGEGATNRDPARYAASLPSRRQPESREVASAVRYLAENNAMIGQILYIDGGERLN